MNNMDLWRLGVADGLMLGLAFVVIVAMSIVSVALSEADESPARDGGGR